MEKRDLDWNQVLLHSSPASLLKAHYLLNLLLEVVCSHLYSAVLTFSPLSHGSHCLCDLWMMQPISPWTSTECSLECWDWSDQEQHRSGCHHGPNSKDGDLYSHAAENYCLPEQIPLSIRFFTWTTEKEQQEVLSPLYKGYDPEDFFWLYLNWEIFFAWESPVNDLKQFYHLLLCCVNSMSLWFCTEDLLQSSLLSPVEWGLP